jgi:hypothetical protein
MGVGHLGREFQRLGSFVMALLALREEVHLF